MKIEVRPYYGEKARWTYSSRNLYWVILVDGQETYITTRYPSDLIG